MNEVDTVELVATCAEMSFTAFGIYISFTFGFLATAFFVGSKLTRFQALVATGMYLVAAGTMALASYISPYREAGLVLPPVQRVSAYM